MTDHLGSTEALTDANGAITSSTSYDSFGNAVSNQATGSAASSAGNATPNIATSYRYTGREYNEDIGLYYYRNRWHDPETGRFISEDPIGFAGGDINLYGYVWNNPQNFIDPYGDISLGSLLSRLFSVGTSTMMLASYVNAPGPGDPVYSPGGNPSLAETIGNALGLIATPMVGKVLGNACAFVLKGIGSGLSKGAGAMGRGIAKSAKSAKRSKGTAAGVSPKPGSLSNKAARRWHHQQLDSIPSRINSSLPLREQALQAFKLRNEIVLKTRELMADRVRAALLRTPQICEKL